MTQSKLFAVPSLSAFASSTMAKENLKTKQQASITSFFGGGSKKSRQDSDVEEIRATRQVQEDDGSSDADREIDDEVPVKAVKKGSKFAAFDLDSSDLPPINEIPAIFSDLVSHIPKIRSVVEHIRGRKLRVATMCSGTESPLLALELIQKSILEQHGLTLEVEHVFSCEIEPFKQAYIERNFQPPLLFRDVCELGNEEAYVICSNFFYLSESNEIGILPTGHWPLYQGMLTCSSLALHA